MNGKRDGLLEHLQAKGIPCAIYYPIPLHSQKRMLMLVITKEFSVNQSIGKRSNRIANAYGIR